MPRSEQPAEGQQIMVADILTDARREVIDVGPGYGKWGRLLRGKVQAIDCVEVWKPYIRRYGLERIYRTVHHANFLDFGHWRNYGVAIFGDVLEHVEVDQAIETVEKLRHTLTIYLTIPITECKQDGTGMGNPYETHRYQWTDPELTALGFRQLHAGPNPSGRVTIGTYVLR